MADKLDPELQQLLQKMADPATQIPFIVTLKKGTRAAGILPCKIDNEFEEISAVSCRMTAKQALDLAKHPSVERVEHDGEMHALRASAAKV
jgi:hypothetical protein